MVGLFTLFYFTINLIPCGIFIYSCRDSPTVDFYKNRYTLTNLTDYPEVCQEYNNEICAEQWLSKINIITLQNINKYMNIDFQNAVNNSKYISKIFADVDFQYELLNKKIVEKAKRFNVDNFKNAETKRLIKILRQSFVFSNQNLPKLLIETNIKISYIYNKAKPCFQKCLSPGQSDIKKLFETERNYDILSGFWQAWRNVTGPKIKSLFLERLKIQNEGARKGGFENAVKFNFLTEFEDENFDKISLSLYRQILPLYRQLHAYVRYCLSKYYPNRFNSTGPIPAHILGNVWGQQWNNIFSIIQKCKEISNNKSIPNEVNEKLTKMKSVKEIFLMAEDFFESIGLYKMNKEFWERSIFTKQKDVIMDCHGSAYNFMNKRDFRIKMCTDRSLNDFQTAHHEMGHIQYYMAYKDLHYLFQGSANSGFHEAIGDVIALSVKTPEHLLKVGLISDLPDSNEFDIDFLMETALEKIAFLPFALTMDLFVWGVYNNSVPFDKLNKYWWDIRYEYQGLIPPVKRSENDFDPASKYHVAFGVSYIRYFVSFIIQFQFYETLCKVSGHKGPLHRCDFYKSKIAGKKLLEMLKLGKSKPWPIILEMFTGNKFIDTKPLLNYFEPLHQWLIKENKRKGNPIGW